MPPVPRKFRCESGVTVRPSHRRYLTKAMPRSERYSSSTLSRGTSRRSPAIRTEAGIQKQQVTLPTLSDMKERSSSPTNWTKVWPSISWKPKTEPSSVANEIRVPTPARLTEAGIQKQQVTLPTQPSSVANR